jgi:hypothetical protein
MRIEGIPVYVQPLLAKGTVMRALKDTPHEYILVDSTETLNGLLTALCPHST